jgi:hypothetical protein
MSPQNTADLHIDPDLRAWIDPLTPDEFAQLEANILAEGCRDPIVVWGSYILDGHNRYEICTRHGIDFSTVEKPGLVTKEDALIWMGEHQLGKRNLSDFSRAALALRMKPLIEQRARVRMLAGRSSVADPVQISAQGSGKTRDEVAKKAGVSHDTVRKVEKILESGNAEVTAQVRAGELSINAAAKKVTPPRPPAPAVTAPVPATGARVRDNTDAPDFGASIQPAPTVVAPAPASLDNLAEPHDADTVDTVELLIAEEEKVKRLEAEVAELRARVDLLEKGDLAKQIVKLEADVRVAADRADRHYTSFTEANNTAMRRKKRLDDIRRAAGLAKDADLVEWARQAARRAA